MDFLMGVAGAATDPLLLAIMAVCVWANRRWWPLLVAAAGIAAVAAALARYAGDTPSPESITTTYVGALAAGSVMWLIRKGLARLDASAPPQDGM